VPEYLESYDVERLATVEGHQRVSVETGGGLVAR
jgi:hypothetical protein